jgi:hypothetical protein
MDRGTNRRGLMKRAGAIGLSAVAVTKLGLASAQHATPAAPDTSMSGELNVAMVANHQQAFEGGRRHVRGLLATTRQHRRRSTRPLRRHTSDPPGACAIRKKEK